jgi:hypothetical protein
LRELRAEVQDENRLMGHLGVGPDRSWRRASTLVAVGRARVRRTSEVL